MALPPRPARRPRPPLPQAAEGASGRLLDPALLARYQEAYARHQALKGEKEALEEALRAKAEREDLLRFQLKEIAEAKPRPGEDEELLQEARSSATWRP